MSAEPGPMDFTFTAPIGLTIKGEVWSCVEVPGSVELFGTGKSVRVTGTVDDQAIAGALMPTGSGGHMISISAALRKKLRKSVGDEVSVHLTERVT